MALLIIADSHIEALTEVISRLASIRALTAEERDLLYKAASDHASNVMLEVGVLWSEAISVPDNYQKSQEEFFGDLKSADNELHTQVKAFSDYVGIWFTKGNHPPPYYSDRITVILRKAKRFDLEKEFLTVYFKHFWSPYGSSADQKLGERAKKIGINIPSIPSKSMWYKPDTRQWAEELNIRNLAIDIPTLKWGEDPNKTLQYKYYCLQCAGTEHDLDDETDMSVLVKCKKCKARFGNWGDIQKWLSRITKKYVQLHSS